MLQFPCNPALNQRFYTQKDTTWVYEILAEDYKICKLADDRLAFGDLSMQGNFMNEELSGSLYVFELTNG